MLWIFPNSMKPLICYALAAIFISGCSSLENFKSTVEARIFQDSKGIYIVKSGDSIWSIALQNNLDPQQIILNNNLTKPYIIIPNQKLSLLYASQNDVLPTPQKKITWQSPLKASKKPSKEGKYWLIYKEDIGRKIYAVGAGRVVISGPDIPGYGNLIMISHPNGFISLYAHCKKINVEVGDFVEAGMEIAEVGSSEASFSMLKFQLRKNGAPVNTSTLRFR